MRRYALTRIVRLPLTVFVIATLTFFGMHAIPGSPALTLLGDRADAATARAITHRLGLDKPLRDQYLHFLNQLVHGNLGSSYVTGHSVLSTISEQLPYTVELAIGGLLIGVVTGIPLGVMMAARRDKPFDYLARVFSLGSLSFPAFFTGVLLITLLAVKVHWLPTGGAAPLGNPVQTLRYLVLPVISLGLGAMAFISRVTRSAVLGEMEEDHIRTARAKGVPERRILLRHAFQPASLPIVSLVGLFFVFVIGGSVVTEVVFARPGMGSLMVNSINARDYPLVLGIAVLYAAMVAVANMLIDLLYGVLDVRVRRS